MPGVNNSIFGTNDFTLPQDSAAMHFLQRLGDESHRCFGASKKRVKTEFRSPLDAVPGIGPKRKSLVGAFGSQQFRLLVYDLEAVDGFQKICSTNIRLVL